MDKKVTRILTGHRPTGPRHIGHLVGTLENWARLQDDYECYFLVADLHVLTTRVEQTGALPDNVLEMLADWLAAGIDPARSKIVLQSALPQHTQLSALLGNLVSVARLERVPTYKEQVHQLKLNPSLGLLAYPLLQSADILLYKAEVVPVGEDQLPHVELTRELARRFNLLFGETFPEPQALLSQSPRLPGLDNRMMHTSYGNTIALRESDAETTLKVMNMYTDPTRIHATDPGHVEGNPVFAYMDLFNPDQDEVNKLKALYRTGKVGDVQIKQRLAVVLNEYLAPLRARRKDLIQHTSDLIDILRQGTQQARPMVQGVIEEVQHKMGLLQLFINQSQKTGFNQQNR